MKTGADMENVLEMFCFVLSIIKQHRLDIVSGKYRLRESNCKEFCDIPHRIIYTYSY